MSHSHSHAPGASHSHSHSHSPLASPQTPQTPQSAQLPPPDPALQALIDQQFTTIPLKLSPDNQNALCDAHSLEKCADCHVDFLTLNRMSRIFANNPNLRFPPPATIVTQKLSQMVTSTKDEGNTLFKKGQHIQAIQRYTAAASFAIQRPPWEANQVMREELSTIISNRSAAFYEAKDYVAALADAEVVIQLRRNWSKGHFRKAIALNSLGRTAEACDAVRLGLSFDPNNQELAAFLTDLLREDKKGEKGGKLKSKSGIDSRPSTPVTA